MPLSNTQSTYGEVAKTLHWLTVLLIFTLFLLGVIAHDMPYGTGEELAAKARLFSIHKTVGILAFFVALARVLWALTQKRPFLLNADKGWEGFLAEMVHGLLYLSILLVPLSGWLHHAATTGFAPVLLPFGDDLPLVPKSQAVAEVFGLWHDVLTKVLLASILLHVAGAFKHMIIDRDGTMRRMWFTSRPVPEPRVKTHARAPKLAALVLYVVALGGASLAAMSGSEEPATPTLAAAPSGWLVEEGSLTFSVIQMGAPITGTFADWTAAINFSQEAVDGSHGDVEVVISIPSLTLGSVTKDALGPEFFAATNFATATFIAEIVPAGEAYEAQGNLTLKGASQPVTLPFTLMIDGDRATMSGTTTLQRLDFGIGPSYPDEGTVGFGVEVSVSLTATRQ